MPVPGNSGAIVSDANGNLVGLFYGVEKALCQAYFIEVSYLTRRVENLINSNDL